MIAHRWASALRLLGTFALALFSGIASAANETEPVSDAVRAEELFAQGLAHAEAGRDSQALQAYQRTWRWDPTRDDALRLIPALATKLKQIDIAARYALIIVRGGYTEAVRTDPALYRQLANHAALHREHALAAELWEALYDQVASPPANRRSLQQKIALEVGKLWFLSGDAVEASDWFHRVAENPLGEVLSSEATKLWEGFASCHLEAERFDRAELALRRLAEQPDGVGRAAYWQAQLALRQHRPAVALEKINACLATEDVGPSGLAYGLLVETLRATNQASRSDKELRRFHENRPNDPDAWLAWIDQLIATGKPSQALDQAQRLVETTLAALEREDISAGDNTVLSEGADRQIKLLGSMNQADQLWSLLEKLSGWWGSLEPVHESLEQVLSQDTLAELAGVWLATRQPEKMSEDQLDVAGHVALTLDRSDIATRFYQPLLTQCVLHDSEHSEDPPTAIDCLHAWLFSLIDSESWPQVIEAIEWARKTKIPQSDSADMSYWLTFGYMHTDQKEKSLSAIRSARKIAPKDLIYAELETTLLADLDRLDEAIVVAKVSLNRFKKSPQPPHELARDLGRILAMWLDERAELDDIDQADELLEAVLDSWPLDPLTNNDLAYRWAERGIHLDRSLRMARLATEANPTNASSADTLGWVLYCLERHHEAAQELRRAVALLSQEEKTAETAVLYEHLAEALEATGDIDEAAKAKAEAERLREIEEK